jgi:hypothetical protein
LCRARVAITTIVVLVLLRRDVCELALAAVVAIARPEEVAAAIVWRKRIVRWMIERARTFRVFARTSFVRTPASVGLSIEGGPAAARKGTRGCRESAAAELSAARGCGRDGTCVF